MIGKGNKRTTEQFILESRETHGDRYGYCEVVYTRKDQSVTILCKIHGYFDQKANAHIRGSGCPECGKILNGKNHRKTLEEFIKEANIVHDNMYSYDESIYVGSREKIKVRCKEHGVFNPTVSNHLRGSGCPTCVESCTWSRSKYVKQAKGRICIFYILRCFNENEEFYKIGITMQTIQNRYNHTVKMPYLYEVISEIYGEAGVVWDLELEDKRKLKGFKYQPEIDFGGFKTECFTKYNVEGV